MTDDPSPDEPFELRDFLPYLLNQAAEETSLAFQPTYKGRYGMLRTEWRVLVHLGRYGPMTASGIAGIAHIHKTKISRAVSALEAKRFLRREEAEEDRRRETLTLTRAGREAYGELTRTAREFDETLAARFSAEEEEVLRRCLRKLANF